MESVGEAVTGGLLARAAEPGAGEARDEAHGACLNCGSALVGDYCHACGQKAHIHRTISAWWHDFLHSVLHLDGKLWRTLPKLAWRPGELTRDYVHGQRARYISPLAIFLFTVFLMFAVFSFAGITSVGVEESEASAVELDVEKKRLQDEITRLETQVAQGPAGSRPVRAAQRRLNEAREEIEAIETGQAISDGSVIGGKVDTGWERLDQGVRKASKNPALLFYKVQANAYKFSWALIPISLPFLWLLFLHRRRYRRAYHAFDHLVFVTYSIAFMSLLAILWVVVRASGLNNGYVTLAFMLVPPVHIFRQLKGAYELSNGSAAWRTFALLIFASIAIGLFFLLLLTIGVLG